MTTGDLAVALACAFALGAILDGVANDHRGPRAAPIAASPAAGASFAPRPRCPGDWIIKRADNGPWRGKCLKGTRT